MNMKSKKKLFIIVFVILNIYGLLCGVLYFFQENLLFMPSILPQEHVFEMKHTFEEVNLIASDGSQLNGLHFRKDEPKGVVLYFHGNAGDLKGWGKVTEPFIELGYSVIIMDYRGYGKSTGKRSQELLYDDAKLWFNYTKQYYKESEITVFGRSLGTTFATYVSSISNPEKLILESPFYSIEDVAKSRFAFLPVSYLLHYKFSTNKYIDKVTCPIIIYHGTKDQVISYEQGKKLYDSFKSNSKKLITIPEGGHNNLASFKEYSQSIEQELN